MKVNHRNTWLSRKSWHLVKSWHHTLATTEPRWDSAGAVQGIDRFNRQILWPNYGRFDSKLGLNMEFIPRFFQPPPGSSEKPESI
jgi:hypothetical protein